MSKSTKFIYPLTVQSVLYANYKSTTNGTWQINYNNYLWNVTNESMNVTNTDNTGTVNVVALVIAIAQQWGTEPGVGTYEYPVPYTALCYGVITNRQVQKSNNATTAVNITLTEFTCSKSDGMGDYTFNWFSAGI